MLNPSTIRITLSAIAYERRTTKLGLKLAREIQDVNQAPAEGDGLDFEVMV